MKIIAWNIARSQEAWRSLRNSDADIALISEATAPPPDVAKHLEVDPAPWQTAGAGRNRPWRTAIVKLSNQVEVEWIETKSISEALPHEIAVSRLGTLTLARVTSPGTAPLIVASMYAAWEKPHPTTGSAWIYADGSVHRLISDLSALVGKQTEHRILAAGDLNILHGYGEFGSTYWASRYATVFARMEALGLSFVGPQAPEGRCAHPWPQELPAESKNVPTYHTRHQTPATATRQLDFVFASNDLAKTTRVCAMNQVEDWGPSDHCRLEIKVS
jgi:exonuclease III